MKRILFLLLSVIMLNTANAATDSYTEALKSFMQFNPSQKQTLDQLKSQLVAGMNAKMNSGSNPIVSEVYALYVQDQMMDDIVASFAPYFKKHVSEEELLKFVDLMQNTPGMMDVYNKEQQLFTTVQQQLSPQLQQAMADITNGKTPTVQQKTKCPTASYQQKMDVHMKSYKVMFDKMFSSIIPIGKNLMRQQNLLTGEKEKQIDLMLEVMKESLMTSYHNEFVRTMSEAELDKVMLYSSSPAVTSSADAVTDMLADMQNFAISYSKRMQTWCEKEIRKRSNK